MSRRMDAAAVTEVVGQMRRHTKSRAACVSLAKLALQRSNLTPCGRAVWEDYLKELGA